MNKETSKQAALFARAAEAIIAADGLIVAAGAGMGVDSGLPDFRGPEGFWGVYPALGRAGIRFEGIANPAAFRDQPELAWGFYGHRLQLYRNTAPGEAFGLLRAIAGRLPKGAFAYTSNVDGHFGRTGFAADRVWECHGSIHHLQCLGPCRAEVWPADDFVPEVDAGNCRLLNEPPRCPHCGGLARPNILMFGDWGWVGDRSNEQAVSYQQWRRRGAGKLVVIEIGAGTQIATVRCFSESNADLLIRINPAAPELGDATQGVSLPLGGLVAMRGITAALDALGYWR